MRLRRKPWAEEEIQAAPQLVIQHPEQLKGGWHEHFGNRNPIHIEVGTGKGRFVTEMAEAHPQTNYIGVELQTSVIAMALRRVKESGAENVRLLNQNVADLWRFFIPGEIERIYINFCDPWPKRRHEKRRLTYKDFLHMYHLLLGPEKEIHFKTDNEGLFEYSLNSFSDFGCRLKNITFDLHMSPFEGNVMTEYEEKFAKKGQRIYRCEAVLPDVPRPQETFDG